MCNVCKMCIYVVGKYFLFSEQENPAKERTFGENGQLAGTSDGRHPSGTITFLFTVCSAPELQGVCTAPAPLGHVHRRGDCKMHNTGDCCHETKLRFRCISL